MAYFCDVNDTHQKKSQWVCAENGREYRLDHASIFCVCKITVDGGLIGKADSRMRSDYLFLACEDKSKEDKLAIIVELKGQDLGHAYKQIESTLDLTEVKQTSLPTL